MCLLKVEDIVSGYGKGPDILKGVSIELQKSNIHCIIGPNGAGKSTLLKTICGMLIPRSGEIFFEQEKISGLRPDQILRKGVIIVPQGRSVFPEMTVQENLLMGAYTLNNNDKIYKRLAEVLEMFPILEERKFQKAATMSGGQQQMLEMARGLILEPKLIMLDEPSLGLAPQVSQHVFGKIGELKELGTSVLMVEQNAREGLKISDWGFVLNLGKNEFEGPAKTLLSNPRIQELYLGVT